LGEKPEESVKRLGIRYRDRWRLYRDLDSSEMLEFYLTSMAMAVDPHSGYMNGKTFEDMVGQQLHLTLDGIGASLSVEDGYPIVKDIVPGGAADKDGRLQIDDKIIGLVNDDGSKEDFVEKKLNDVVRKIRGPRDTKVRIMVQPANSKEVKVYELTRAKIELVESRAKARVIDHKVEGREEPLKLGIIDLPSFYGDTEALGNGDPNATSATADCRKILDDFKKQKVDVVLMDLRGNPGGLLIEACSLSGLFIDEGPVVQIRENAGVKPMGDDVAGTAWDGPLAVVIDKTSASASEIFAGVIKDYSRGLIIGDSSTFGKGTVQTLVPLNSRLGIRGDQVPNLGALKLTIQQFYRPDGASTQMKGVESDVHIPSTLDHLDLGETKLDSALKFDQIPALPHDQYNRAPADLIAQLIQRSEARRGQHEKFREDARYLQKLIERKKRHEISLNEEKFRAEVRAEKDEEEENRNGRRRPSKREIWESNHYNDEILSILGDYVTLGSRVLIAAPVRAGANAAEPPALMP
jgi:carboxyl-terminal processing protease